MAALDAFIAATRFGMGAAPGDLDRISGDPRGWLQSQIAPQPLPNALASLPDGAERFEEYKQIQLAQKARKADPNAADPVGPRLRDLYVEEAAARSRAAIESQTPLVERLSVFWANHFTVSVARPVVTPLAGAFEREAIRPHIFGHFHDMLRAVAGHPAMLLYLDNAVSVGPHSRNGIRSGRGINENLAREMLELHTLGVGGGYTQQDVIALADILTGWSVAGAQERGNFVWRPMIHEPGDKLLLGTLIPGGGQEEGEQALLLLARHSATARHVATQLVRHFIADDPPPAAVDAVARAFTQSDGDLAVVTRAVIARPEAWAKPLSKVKSPNDFVISTLRALGAPPVQDQVLVQSLRLLGQAPFSAPQPEGWPDDAQSWLGPEALMVRLEWARSAGKRVGVTVDAPQMAARALGPVQTENTFAAIAQAGKPPDQLAMLLVSPEFQRR